MYLPSPGYNDQIDRNGAQVPNHGGQGETSNTTIPTANILHSRVGYAGNGMNPLGIPPSMSMQQYQQLQQMQQAQQMQQMQQLQQMQQIQHMQQLSGSSTQMSSQIQPPMQQIPPQYQPQMQAAQSQIHNPAPPRLQQPAQPQISQYQQQLQYPQHFQQQMQIPYHHTPAQRHDELMKDSQSPPQTIPNVSQEKFQERTMLVKKKRGRPKKLILDPSTKSYIDSSHPRFKQLNKILKESSNPSTPNSSLGHMNGQEGSRQLTQVTHLRDMDDEAVKELLKRKDRRGRPRKFPIEETGLTIKGIRVNGVAKNRKAKSDMYVSPTSGPRLEHFGLNTNGPTTNLNRDHMSETKLPQSSLNAIDNHIPNQTVKYKDHMGEEYS
ncbi:hypothetical protein PGUG_05088 [Meyerozyma guilliermondii ATCC 6260]|uniref:Uncharacterized protein n=1 Tax=Meyerozyma guilliermondii (strain ATCC 6260 / CBS 566 / DSM 6381 / JCM 1539 / NBRC 10279 / NRRL Y-324) TaxID=294746 RepID=A5DP87_PICGU|nr:uncharacterized protein PGUG_05088 [Meyerozyma guilliermondii ATCC 6260]EDK40990.2 hypothetical protein PGUG_05088 [Meyerozyma guilliermondii ATCC 6260]